MTDYSERAPIAATAGRMTVAVIVTVIFLFPVYWLFVMSIKTPEEVFASPPVWWPETVSFENFAVLFRDGDVRAIWNSLVIAGVSTVIAMFLGTISAYSLARYRTGGDHLAIWIISQRMIPPITIVFPIFLAFALIGLNDTYLGMIALYTAFNLPYVIWMMRGYVEDVPLELEESALVDGLNRWQTLLKVVFPMMRTGLFATAVFTFIFAWNEFIFALILTRTEVITFPVQVSHFFGPQQIFWAKIGAMSVLGTLPVFFAVAMAQKLLVRGMSMGAVKG
ncbi:MAG: carbohydrate ABC transporter permease [Hyphomicrobiales bacterium]|nr:carbohydrate ABC transporter permease [Hyphomicrobiales bacterium]